MSAVLQPDPWIQPLKERDIETVAAIEREIYEFPWTLGNFRDSLAAGYSCWALDSPEGLIGYAVMMLGASEAHLLNLSIAPSYQRRGLGAGLLEHLIRIARAYGAHVIFLEVRRSNTAGQRLYARYGFAESGLRKDYYPAARGREDALIFSLAL
jgi:ribosomal-protein-alanine N-acetyltransferase